MLSFKDVDGKFIPMFKCDHCGKIIELSESAENSLVGVYDTETGHILTYHKIVCDQPRNTKRSPWISGEALIAAIARNYEVNPKSHIVQLDSI